MAVINLQSSNASDARASRRGVDLSRLLALAAAIPSGVVAQEATTTEFQISYFNYEDSQGSGEDRMTIDSPMLYGKHAFGEGWEIEGTFQLDDMSGASPQYLDALSGATGLGIEDRRRLGDVRLTRAFDRFSVSLGGALSTEDDWTSRSASLEGRWWTDDKNTTITLGVSPIWDRITSTNNIGLLERRRSLSWILGVTQVLTPNSIIQSNLYYMNADGYMTDQYKFFDKRPRSRDEYVWLTRYNHFIESCDAALHADYRLALDSWDMSSHMVEIKWYQPIGDHVVLRPQVRYYTQDKSEFFSTEVPPSDFESFYSADQRLSAFGSLAYGAKLEVALNSYLTLDALIEFIEQRGGWRLFGSGTTGLKPFHARFTGVGISARF